MLTTMAEEGQPSAGESRAGIASGAQKQYPISCTYCRQRKIKCDKIHPCSPCQRSNLHCVFLERVRHPKKKQNGPATTTNDELIRRLGRMEELIKKMEVEGKDSHGVRQRSTDSQGQGPGPRDPDTPQSMQTTSDDSPHAERQLPDATEDATNKYLGSNFWRSLANEVGSLSLLESGHKCFGMSNSSTG